jgi:outer membrane protein TolC
VDALGNYLFNTETSRLVLDIPGPGGVGGTSINRVLSDHDQAELGVDATVPIFTGFARGYDVESRQAQARSRESETLAARNRLSLRLAMLFAGWQLADAQARYEARVVAYSRKLEGQLADFVRAGTAVRSRALAGQARTRSAEVDRIAAENTRDSLALEVFSFLGRGLDSALGSSDLKADTTPAPAPPWESPSEGDPGDRGSGAAGDSGTSRPEERAYEEGIHGLRLGQKALAGRRLPQVLGRVGVRFANPGLNVAKDEFMAYGQAALQLRWNIFDGYRNRQQRVQLELQARSLEEQRRKQRTEWEKARRSARQQYARWSAQWDAARAAREAARSAADDLQRQFELGLATEVDLMEALNNEARSELVMEQARTFRKLAMLQWEYAAGREMRF